MVIENKLYSHKIVEDSSSYGSFEKVKLNTAGLGLTGEAWEFFESGI